MNLEERKNALVELGHRLSFSLDIYTIAQKAKIINPWFSVDSTNAAIAAIIENFLNLDKLNEWLSKYSIKETAQKKIGLILAGNIPLVGFHDIISVFLSGHKSIIKLSEKDSVLTKFIFSELFKVNPKTEKYFQFEERLKEYDAVIATGSDSTGKYFEKYFKNVPSIIRKNRHGVAVVTSSNSKEQIQALGNDIFKYFGLGCRNVSKVYLKKGLKVDFILDELESYKEVANHNKYKNNYDYTYALYLMNSVEFFTNDFLIMKPDSNIVSRIATLHYEHFDDLNLLEEHLIENQEKIQCVVGDVRFKNIRTLPFGESQRPALWDYADGVDTLDFLIKLK